MEILPDAETTFITPKPTSLLTRILLLACEKDSLVLDSFAGSGTTGHAVMKLNAADGGNRRFILVEMEEKIARSITAERLKRVIPTLVPAAPGGGAGGEAKAVGFQFCTLGEPLFDATGQINKPVPFTDLARHVFFSETGCAPEHAPTRKSPLIGIHHGVAYYLLFNGILGDKRPDGGNVLTGKVLDALPAHDGPRVIFGEGCRLGQDRLKRENLTFRQLPYEVKVS